MRVHVRHAHIPAGGHSDGGIRKLGDEQLEGPSIDAHRGVGVDDNVAAQLPASRVLGGALAAPLREAQQLHPPLSEPGHDDIGAIARRVRDDEDLASLHWIVELEEPLQCAGDHLGFVVHWDRNADGGPLPQRRWRPPAPAAEPQQLEQDGVTDVAVQTRSQPDDERDGGRAAHPTNAAGAARATWS